MSFHSTKSIVGTVLTTQKKRKKNTEKKGKSDKSQNNDDYLSRHSYQKTHTLQYNIKRVTLHTSKTYFH